MLITCDFNYPCISWEGFEADNKHVKFLDLVQERFFFLKFTYDTKLFGVLTSCDDVEMMRADLCRLCDWSKE